MALWMYLPVFLAGLALVCVVVDRRVQAFTALVLLVVWLACTYLDWMYGPNQSVLGKAIIDFSGALLLLSLPNYKRGHTIIAGLLAMQIVATAGLNIVGHTPLSEWRFYWIQFGICWAQALACAAWALTSGMALRNPFARRRSLVVDEVRESMGARGERR